MSIDLSVVYPGQVATADAGYPYGKPRNVTAPGAGDGTPWEERIVRDIVGLLQSLLVAARITPSGVPDSVVASDYFTAIMRLRRMDTEGARFANSEEYDTVVLNNNIGVVVAGPWGGETAVVVGATGGELATSPDGQTFTQRTPGGGYVGTFLCGAASPTLVVMAGTGGEIQTSADGVTWTHRTPFGSYSGEWICASYGGGLFVLMGEDGEIQTSPDGATWTQRTPPTGFGAGDDWKDVIYDGARFIAFGGLGGDPTASYVALSTDGMAWTQAAGAPAEGPTRAGQSTVDGQRILVCGALGGGYFSDDLGATWTSFTVTSSKGVSSALTTIRAARGVIVAIGNASSEHEAHISPSGDVWTFAGRVGGNVAVRALVYAADRWIAGRTAGHVVRTWKAAR